MHSGFSFATWAAPARETLAGVGAAGAVATSNPHSEPSFQASLQDATHPPGVPLPREEWKEFAEAEYRQAQTEGLIVTEEDWNTGTLEHTPGQLQGTNVCQQVSHHSPFAWGGWVFCSRDHHPYRWGGEFRMGFISRGKFRISKSCEFSHTFLGGWCEIYHAFF